MEIINNGLGEHNSCGYTRIDKFDDETTNKLSHHYKEILKLTGDDHERDGLAETPLRVAKAIQFLMQGYGQNPEKIIKSAIFKEDYKEMVIVKDIELYSMCEHHMIPFFWKSACSLYSG